MFRYMHTNHIYQDDFLLSFVSFLHLMMGRKHYQDWNREQSHSYTENMTKTFEKDVFNLVTNKCIYMSTCFCIGFRQT